MKENLCIYHANCSDGFAAACVVKRFAPEEYSFHAGKYGTPPPYLSGVKRLLLVDFSYPRDVLIEMARAVEQLVVLDHHKTAEEQLVDLPSNVEVVFDMNRCGAKITWGYFQGLKPPPLLLRYVQDRDLWRWELPNSKEFSAGLWLVPKEFDAWLPMLEHDWSPRELIEIGSHVLMSNNAMVSNFVRRKPTLPRVEIAGHNVICINTTTLISEIGEALSHGEPFVALYRETEDKRVYSLRSSKCGGEDVAKVAEMFGGGGHRNAAGFVLPRPVHEFEY